MTDGISKVSVVIPARNEEKTIRKVVKSFSESNKVHEVIVVDSASDDATSQKASEAGATVVKCDRPGYGLALKTGYRVASCDWIFKVDGDISNPNSNWVTEMVKIAEYSNAILVKTFWQASEVHPQKVSRLVAKPALRILFPESAPVRHPLSGIYLFHKALIQGEDLQEDFSVEVQMLVAASIIGAKVQEYRIEIIDHATRPLDHYEPMAEQILRYLISKKNAIIESSS